MFSNSKKSMINICANTRTHASSSLQVCMTWSLIFYFKINSIQVNTICFVCFIVLFIRSGYTQFKYHCWPMANGQVFFVVLLSCLNKTWLNIHLIYTHVSNVHVCHIHHIRLLLYALNERTPKHVQLYIVQVNSFVQINQYFKMPSLIALAVILVLQRIQIEV